MIVTRGGEGIESALCIALLRKPAAYCRRFRGFFSFEALRDVISIDLFWICSCLPGYALVRRLWPGVHDAGLLAVIACSALATFLVLSPLSLACYAFGAPLYVFSAGVVAAIGLGAVACFRARAHRDLLACIRRENVCAWLPLLGLLWLQARVGAYFSGDATFHLGRIRVLLEHGFTNRDIYLADYYFQHIYHSNLLFPMYASASQLSGENYFAAWFYSQAWAKLLVASGHYVLGYALTRRSLGGWLSALIVITANTGETYTTYPNTLAVGWLLPLQLAAAFTLLGSEARRLQIGAIAAASFVTAQVHALYAVYAGLAMGPALALLIGAPVARGKRGLIALGLAASLAAAPFLVVSQYGFRPASGARPPPSTPPAGPAPEARTEQPDSGDAVPTFSFTPLPPPTYSPQVNKGKPIVPTPAVAAGGGHLEKSLEMDERDESVWLPVETMGGRWFFVFGFVGFALALVRDRERRWPLAAAAAGTVFLAVLLLWPPACTLALRVLQQPFAVARLSTVLSSLLMLGIAAALCQVPELRWRKRGRSAGAESSPTSAGASRFAWIRGPSVVAVLVVALAIAASTRLTGHAPLFFSEVVHMALLPREVRHATLEMLEARRAMLQKVVPAGTTVLTTARFARSVVMMCDCYVIIADRGHTYVSFAKERREHLLLLNGPNTPWPERADLLRRYGLKLVIFESRHLRRLYRWSHEHGTVIGEAAGLEVVALRDL